LEQWIDPEIDVKIDGDTGEVCFARKNDERKNRALHGLYRSLVNNMVTGLSKGFEKRLSIVGVGYNAQLKGNAVVLQIGFCHPVDLPLPAGIEVEIPNPTSIVVRGVDKQLVGQYAANIRKVRPPEPYKGKGIRYDNEIVRQKVGKSLAT